MASMWGQRLYCFRQVSCEGDVWGCACVHAPWQEFRDMLIQVKRIRISIKRSEGKRICAWWCSVLLLHVCTVCMSDCFCVYLCAYAHGCTVWVNSTSNPPFFYLFRPASTVPIQCNLQISRRIPRLIVNIVPLQWYSIQCVKYRYCTEPVSHPVLYDYQRVFCSSEVYLVHSTVLLARLGVSQWYSYL